MILLAESGSTKTEWIFADKNSIIARCNTKGLNPYFVSSDDISTILQNEVLPIIDSNALTQIFFYGAGCSTLVNKNVIVSGFSKVFKLSNIEVDHDLMAAARALFHASKGIACILGTGSNTCIYDGSSIAHKTNSLGYILGDEGSGSYLGKQLLSAYFNKELPPSIAASLEKEYSISLEKVLETVYKKPFPNKYLASFSPFLKQNLDNKFIYNIVKKSFVDFFEKMILKLPNFEKHPIGFVGSIAYEYENILSEISKDFGMEITSIIKNPADELLKYHQHKCR